LTSADLSARAGALATEWRKDDRVDFAIVELTIGANAKELNIRGDITRSDPDLQPFKLLIAVVDGKALLQAILEG
jgi:hypothetical protein